SRAAAGHARPGRRPRRRRCAERPSTDARRSPSTRAARRRPGSAPRSPALPSPPPCRFLAFTVAVQAALPALVLRLLPHAFQAARLVDDPLEEPRDGVALEGPRVDGADVLEHRALAVGLIDLHVHHAL